MNLSKPGPEGTLYRYRVEYERAHAPGLGTTDVWGYNYDHALAQFEVKRPACRPLAIARAWLGSPHSWKWVPLAPGNLE